MKSFLGLINVVENIALRGKEISPKHIGKENYKTFTELMEETKKPDKKIKKKRLGYSKLVNKLYEIIFLATPSKYTFNLKQRKHIKIVRLNAIARMLIGFQELPSAIDLFNEIFEDAKKIDENEFIFQSSKWLFSYQAYELKNLKKAEEYFNECEISISKIHNEIKIEWYYANIINSYSKSKKVSNRINKTVESYIKELRLIDQKFKTAKFSYNFLSLLIIYHETSYDYFSIVKTIQEEIINFRKYYPNSIYYLEGLNFRLCTYLIRIESYESVKIQLDITLKSIMKYSNRWIMVNSEKILYLLRILQFKKAINTAEEIINSKAFGTSLKEYDLKIEVMHKYAIVCLAYENKDLKLLRSIKLARFMNSILEHDADKQAMNIPTIILQILYYILKRDYDKLEAKFDAINKYLNRYVKSDDLFRSFSFIKMLMQVHRRNFHPVAIDRHTQKYQKNLASIPYIESKEPIEIEFVKYEDLWELVMTFLKTDTRKTRLRR